MIYFRVSPTQFMTFQYLTYSQPLKANNFKMIYCSTQTVVYDNHHTD
jgi:hypothetical protein